MGTPVHIWDTSLGDRVLQSSDLDGFTMGATTPASGTFTTLGTSGGTAAAPSLIGRTVTTAIVASTTQTRAGATALSTEINVVATVANAADALRLPQLNPGQSADVYNNGANSASVFPRGAADAIDGGSAGASVALANAKRCRYTCVAANVIISAQLGAVSA